MVQAIEFKHQKRFIPKSDRLLEPQQKTVRFGKFKKGVVEVKSFSDVLNGRFDMCSVAETSHYYDLAYSGF